MSAQALCGVIVPMDFYVDLSVTLMFLEAYMKLILMVHCCAKTQHENMNLRTGKYSEIEPGLASRLLN